MMFLFRSTANNVEREQPINMYRWSCTTNR